ncbi:MAG: chain-length determining protein [Pseudomonadota bacterium]|nr:chain-length determining protein [Pseudomonadota bacterium]
MNDPAQVLPQQQPVKTNISRMGHLLLEQGKIGNRELQSILAYQKQEGVRFGEAAIALKLVEPRDVQQILALQFAYPPAPGQQSQLDPALLCAFQPDSPTAEGYRVLRSELMLRYFKDNFHQSLPLVGTGDPAAIARSSANLAVAFSQLGLRTLLVDCNLRNPQLHSLFGLANGTGLSDWLAARSRTAPITIPELPALAVLSAGTPAPNPQELISSPRFDKCLKAMCREFEITILNTAPADQCLDAQLIAAQAQSALILATQHQSRIQSLEQICNRLSSINIRILGVALST